MHATTLGPIVNTTSQVNGTGVPAGGPTSATLNVVSAVPALSWWTVIALAAVLAAMATLKLRA
jgi:predicted NBD/HSP70 family sugar kinase